MDTYTLGAEEASKVVTEAFSHSFSSAIELLDTEIRQDIYNIYGLVRVADEIVDSYRGEDIEKMLSDLEEELYKTLERKFSANIIVHAFCNTALRYNIKKELIEPFFTSMKMDLSSSPYTEERYKTYIHGSAEVVGLMCLKVFTFNNSALYEQLKQGAISLGAAYQKVNFLRDIKDDYDKRGRFYFPYTTYEDFDDDMKSKIVENIVQDFKAAEEATANLPSSSRFATRLSYDYYLMLLRKLEATPAAVLKQERISLNKWVKLRYLVRARAKQYVR